VRSTLHHERFRLIALLTLIGSFLFTLFYIENLLISLVLAFVVYYILAPVVNLCERRGLSRGLSIFLIYSLNTLVVVGCFYVFIPLMVDQLSLLEKELPELQLGFLNLVTRVEAKIQSVFHLGEPIFRDNLRNWMISQTTEFTTLIPKWVSDSLTLLFLTPFLAFFMLRDGSEFKRGLLKITPNRYFETVLKLIYDMNDQVGSFIRARFAEALIVGLVTWIGMLIIGFPFAALLALFAAVTNLIPYVGPIIGAVPAFIILFVNSEPMFGSINIDLFALSAVYLTAHIIDAVFIIPIVVAKIVDLHPVTVVIVIILGAQVLGIVGMIISIPVASLIKLIFSSFYRQTL
jgi:putative permease